MEIVRVSTQSCWALVLEKLIDAVRANALHATFQFVFPEELRGSLPGVSLASQPSVDSESPVMIPLQGEEAVKTARPLEAWDPTQLLLQSMSSMSPAISSSLSSSLSPTIARSSSRSPTISQPSISPQLSQMPMETNVESSQPIFLTPRGFFLSHLHFLLEDASPRQPLIVSKTPFVPQAPEEDGPLTPLSQEMPSMTMAAADRQRNQKCARLRGFSVAVSSTCASSSATPSP